MKNSIFFNPYNVEIFVYKPKKKFEKIINVLISFPLFLNDYVYSQYNLFNSFKMWHL